MSNVNIYIEINLKQQRLENNSLFMVKGTKSVSHIIVSQLFHYARRNVVDRFLKDKQETCDDAHNLAVFAEGQLDHFAFSKEANKKYDGDNVISYAHLIIKSLLHSDFDSLALNVYDIKYSKNSFDVFNLANEVQGTEKDPDYYSSKVLGIFLFSMFCAFIHYIISNDNGNSEVNTRVSTNKLSGFFYSGMAIEVEDRVYRPGFLLEHGKLVKIVLIDVEAVDPLKDKSYVIAGHKINLEHDLHYVERDNSNKFVAYKFIVSQ